MLATGSQFCDFYVWTNCNSLQIIIDNGEDLQAEIINKAKNPFYKVQLTLVFTNMVFSEFQNILNKKSRSLQFG